MWTIGNGSIDPGVRSGKPVRESPKLRRLLHDLYPGVESVFRVGLVRPTWLSRRGRSNANQSKK
jgi:hypothetical protein